MARSRRPQQPSGSLHPGPVPARVAQGRGGRGSEGARVRPPEERNGPGLSRRVDPKLRGF